RGRGYEAWFWKKSPSEFKNNTSQFDKELMLKNDLSKLELESIKNLYPDEFEKMIKELRKQKKEEEK
ncbi:MAG: hypothetical protein EBS55_14620, partial [Flavobacteriaceae bacterium]|nr:hypothetical protein [Flavobacteriaceae bacterium]